jgi:hypothetical protein
VDSNFRKGKSAYSERERGEGTDGESSIKPSCSQCNKISKLTWELHMRTEIPGKRIPVVDELTPPIPRRSCKKSLGVVVEATVEAGAPSELKSSKSAKGAEVGFATPFGSLRLPGVTVGASLSAEIVACVAVARFTR